MNNSLVDVPIVDGQVELAGVLDVAVSTSGVVPYRLPSWTRTQFADPGAEVTMQMPAGVRLRFRTDATVVEVDAMLTHIRAATEEVRPGWFELVVDGEVIRSRSSSAGHQVVLEGLSAANVRFVAGEPVTIRFENLPGTMNDVEIWLPHHCVVELRALRVPEHASVEEPTRSRRPLWLHYGSSISHCTEVEAPTRTWPAIAARSAGVDLLNLGFAANCHLDSYVARTIRDTQVDMISLKLGINVVNGDTLRERTFEPAVHGFLDTVRDGHPNTPILVVSPIWCPSIETHPGPNSIDADGRFVAVDGPELLRIGALTLKRVRETLKSIVDVRRGLGDQDIHYLDGLELFGEADGIAGDLPDDLHPNEAGYTRMGERFAQLAFGNSGPFREVAIQG